ncbi:hypothetical protein FXN63_24910 [Pigmentiphaga aceris]|uniref:Uncharacterized protein n=1 Tax=Pigmentiphaga aceris TaxID=1940612 RepID=A0A5C0B465_9BURK|nr:hypothetical protein [Pigmentiphaga aceris]QEI08724.1 hypothetical protein FXN63_24910 [Pigmentiphaga aceris]
MPKQVKWAEDDVLVVQVDASLFTLAQVRKNCLMEFFDVFRSVDDWHDVDLNDEKILFSLFVADKPLRPMFARRLAADEVTKNSRPIIRNMLSFEWLAENTYTANLIELTDQYSNIDARVIKRHLTVEDDLALIQSHDFCGMVGDPKKLLNRLRFIHATGVNWDEQKKFIYPKLERPAGFPA